MDLTTESMDGRAEGRAPVSPGVVRPDGGDRAVATRPVLAVVDVRVAGWLDCVGVSAPSCQVELVDTDEDGLSRIAEALEATGTIERLVVIAEGRPGAIRLGRTEIDVETLERASQPVGRIRAALGGVVVSLHAGTATTGLEGRRLFAALGAALGATVTIDPAGAGAGRRDGG